MTRPGKAILAYAYVHKFGQGLYLGKQAPFFSRKGKCSARLTLPSEMLGLVRPALVSTLPFILKYVYLHRCDDHDIRSTRGIVFVHNLRLVADIGPTNYYQIREAPQRGSNA